jgi:hypothetical protein
MKFIYTILFFVDTVLLVGLFFLFLEDIDNGSKGLTLILILSGIAASILTMIFLLRSYIKQPPGSDHE